MRHLVLIHWNRQEAEPRVESLRQFGYQVTLFSEQRAGADGLKPFRTSPPSAFVIDLSRLPSHGLAVGTWLRRTRATRTVPLLFVDGAPEKVARVRTLLPDAVYTDWRSLRSALEEALTRGPCPVAVPDAMAGYSGRPLAQKLGIRAGAAVSILGAPEGFEETLDPIPEGVNLSLRLQPRADLVLLFCDSMAGLEKRFPSVEAALHETGGVWIAWPKKSSGVRTDLGDTQVRRFALGCGFVDYKVCAIDRTWSGLLFTRRRVAAGTAPRTRRKTTVRRATLAS